MSQIKKTVQSTAINSTTRVPESSVELTYKSN